MILENEVYTPEQRREIQDYNKDDVDDTIALLTALGGPVDDIDHALFRGRYMAAVTRMERVGLPVDSEYLLDELAPNWNAIRQHYIQREDEFHLYDGVDFNEGRLRDLIEKKGWDWPRTPTGKYQLKIATIGKQATRYPELKSLARLRDQIAELRINKLANTVGPDGFSRIPLLSFWTVTGRNQPSAKEKMFLLSLPTWLHGILKPPRDMALVELDFVAEEPAIVAGLSGDPAMIADYQNGDVHWLFAVRAGLAAPDAAVDDRIRELCKPVCHGMNYGITPYGIAARTKKSLDWAREMQARHRASGRQRCDAPRGGRGYRMRHHHRRTRARCILDFGIARRARHYDRAHDRNHGRGRTAGRRHSYPSESRGGGALAAMPRRCPQARRQRPGDVVRGARARPRWWPTEGVPWLKKASCGS
jgi:hypothetical protein